jgi:hypothetical protein
MQNKDCLCGKSMLLLAKTQESLPKARLNFPHDPIILVWVCPPDGCGRILLESSGIPSTWYLPELNEKEDIFG